MIHPRFLSMVFLLLAATAALADDAPEPKPAPAQPASDYQNRFREQSAKVLSQSEFNKLRAEEEDDWSLMRTLLKAIASIGKFFANLPGWLYWTLVIWMVLALLAIMAHLIYTLVKLIGASRGGAQSPGQAAAIHGELLGVRNLDHQWVFAEANRLAAAGQPEAAIRHFYVGCILWLDRKQHVTFRKSKTNHDYARELAKRPAMASAFTRMTNLFETTAFGEAPATQADCQSMAELSRQLSHELDPSAKI